MSVVILDTETCGLHGMAVLIQYAWDDGEVHLHSPWTVPIIDTLKLIESFLDCDGIIGFNLAFDFFHLVKLYTVFSAYHDWDAIPEDIIDELAYLEPGARDGPCLKPKSAHDVMLHARKGPYQSTMARGDIRIKKVPTVLAYQLAQELHRRVPLADIYFAKRPDLVNGSHWEVFDVEDADGEIEPDFKDVVLRFAPSAALKALAVDAGIVKKEDVLLFGDIEVPKVHRPVEEGYAPFALAIGTKENWKGAWPEKIRFHITHWAYNELARKYAKDDVIYTRALYKLFGSPPLGDHDSILSCMIAAVRWKGFKINVEGIRQLKAKAIASRSKILPNGQVFVIPTAPAPARWYVEELMDETERLCAAQKDGLNVSTKKTVLESVTKYTRDCPDCIDPDAATVRPRHEECPTCKNKRVVPHPAAERAREVLDARQSQYEENMCDKLLLAGRFHASFNVIGALSSRMSGGDGFNAQGVKKTKEIRGQFPLADEEEGEDLSGGDFSAFEVTIAIACYGDKKLEADVLSGKKIHALFGVHVFPDMTYEEILASEGTKDDKYTRCKSAVFAMFYGGEGYTLKTRLGVDIETADKAFLAFCKAYSDVGKANNRIIGMFQAVTQAGGLGSKVAWRNPSDYIESMLGFRRYFTLENKIMRALYELAQRPPRTWVENEARVKRRDREQSASGAVQSALYGATFGLQSSNIRAAKNHEIQSTGAQITKDVQVEIWTLQPPGVNKWQVRPMNIHDEIMCPCKKELAPKIKELVQGRVKALRSVVPLLKIDWQEKLNSWAEKG